MATTALPRFNSAMNPSESVLAFPLSFSIALHIVLLSMPLKEHETAVTGTRIFAEIKPPSFTNGTTQTHSVKSQQEFHSPAPRRQEEELSDTTSSAMTGSGYLPSSTLDEIPEVIADISPDFLSHQALALYGRMTLTLFVGERGQVDLVAADETLELPGAVIAEISRHFYQLRFRPGKIHGNVTRFKMFIEIIVAPAEETRTETPSNG